MDLSNADILALIAYHSDMVTAACVSGIDSVAHEKIATHGSAFHRYAQIGEDRGIFQRPSA